MIKEKDNVNSVKFCFWSARKNSSLQIYHNSLKKKLKYSSENNEEQCSAPRLVKYNEEMCTVPID
jgi:regulatory protein YycI of two-component signal transduction system YycFG